MKDPAAHGSGRARGRVVMLVDNAVHGDSRVQKQARSAAEAGWDVVLIGRAPSKKPDRFRLGGARVRLVPVESTMARRPHELRSGRRPGRAYANRRLAAYRRREAEVRAYDARLRQLRRELEAAQGRRSALSVTAGKAWTRAVQAGSKVERRWVAARGQDAPRRPGPVEPRSDRLTDLRAKAMGVRGWRLLHPHRWDFELAFGPVIDRLQPDIIHANDFGMIGVGAAAKLRAFAAGRDVKLVYDAHEYVPGMNAELRPPGWLDAQIAYEREFIGLADEVVTVSEPLAEMLAREHGIARPTVVLNAPVVEEISDVDVPTVRQRCGVADDTPILLYSGSMTPQRGVSIMVDALPHLPDAHVAFVVSSTEKPFVRELMQRAEERGVSSRVHWLPYVAPEHVVHYVADATVGVHPTHHFVNHEISLATKFFEYAHAGLPIVVSDVRTMAEMVRRTGQGEVFRAEDLDDYLRAVRQVLADPGRYRAAYRDSGLLQEWTWERQAQVLDSVYSRLRR